MVGLNIEMPRNCAECAVFPKNATCQSKTGFKCDKRHFFKRDDEVERHEDCPLIKVPNCECEKLRKKLAVAERALELWSQCYKDTLSQEDLKFAVEFVKKQAATEF